MKARQNHTAIAYDKKGRVICIARNSYSKTHPIQAKYAKKVGRPHKIYLHAEILACLRAEAMGKDVHRLHVFRIGADGKERNSKPCSICREFLKDVGVKNITHS